ncbi:MAG TPA: hypothetical protein VG942_18310, partial [Hyphomonadaceae bacterium]|nr:hypothetical protein [Hyphomonadaceae bacterium]
NALPAGPSALGKVVGDFSLTDQNGVAWTLRYDRTAPAIALVSYAVGDKTSRHAADVLQRLRAKYPNVEFALLDSEAADTVAKIEQEAKSENISLPLLADSYQIVGEDLGVTRSGEAFLVDPKTWKVIYHGPVDVSDAINSDGSYLDTAIADHLAGRATPVPEAPVKGVAISFPDRTHQAGWAAISFTKDIAPILAKNCVDCHEPGGIAPWQMTSYEVVKGFSPMIREVLRTDRMPPYNADPHVGQFQMDGNLSEADTKTLLHWIAAGSPRGDGEDPLKSAAKQRPEWPLGKPDLVVDIPPYNLPATGVVDYQYPVVASPLKEGKWLKATTFKAGSRQGVHHILAGWIPKMPTGGRGFSWNVSMGGYAVGAESNLAPAGWGTYIPPGGAISLQMHYTPFGKPMTDYSKIGFYFMDKAPKYVMRQAVIADPTIVIPAGEARHHERGYMIFPAAVKLYGAQPHAHYRGYSSKLTLVYPDGKEKVILNLPQYDFNWQREYIFKDLIDVPAGSKLVADYIYDNSTNNKANPDPTKTIQWGEQSFQEMLFTAVRYRWADETADHRRDDLQKQLESSLLFTAIDDNIDGKLQLAELKSDMLEPVRAHFADLDKNHDGALSPDEFGEAMKQMQRRRPEAS